MNQDFSSQTKERVLEPERVHGLPVARLGFKTIPSDFIVEEILSFPLSGEGEHLFIQIEKTSANTQWVAQQIAHCYKVSFRDIGFAGHKDRHGVTRQWFSVYLPGKTCDETLEIEGVRVLEMKRNAKKLRAGGVSKNRFKITLRKCPVSQRDTIEMKWRACIEKGFPNYYGPQRFGLKGSNLELMEKWATRQGRLNRIEKKWAISTARSFLFNEVLCQRVLDGTWNQWIDGEVANLNGKGSFFKIEQIDQELIQRLNHLEIHPTGPLWGKGESPLTGKALAFEEGLLSNRSILLDRLKETGSIMDRRPLRVQVLEPEIIWQDTNLILSFALRSGAYATVLLRELVELEETL